jgi:hypothetical protein
MIKVLFDLKKEYYFNSFFPLYQEMIKDPRYDLWVHIGKNHKRLLGIFLVQEKKRITSDFINKGYQLTDEVSGFDLVICGDALHNPVQYGETLRVHLDHGVGIKTLRIRNVIKQKTVHYHIFLEGQYWFDYIKSLGWQDRADFHITGLPKLDPLFWDNYYNNDKLVKKLKLNPNKKTVLFAPSYRPSCIKYIKEKIIDLVPKYNLIIKLHPYSWGGKYAPHSHHLFYERLAKENREIFLIPEAEYDIYPYIYLADTLISDTSSVVNEFLALGKHGCIYVLQHEKLNHSDGMPILSINPNDWLKGAFPHILKPNDLILAVESALNPTEEMKSKLKEYRDYFFTGLDGKSGKRVKLKIDELMNAEKI